MKRLLQFILIVPFVFSSFSQEEVAAIGFWNVENLYDTINDRFKNDDEFTPGGANAWTGERYRHKLRRISEVIGQIALNVSPHGLALLGLCEVENKRVLTDLVSMPAIKSRNYQFILIEGPDARGIDPALLYNPHYFKLQRASSHLVHLPDSAHKTRDVLLVCGLFCGEAVAVFVNHWPSRWGGEAASSPGREAAARVVRRLCDSLRKIEPRRKIVIMGDLNDDPLSPSVKKTLGCAGKINDVKNTLFFNPMEKLYHEGTGSLAWNDSWNLFDQVILDANWLKKRGFLFREAVVFNKEFLRNSEGNFRGYPFRSFGGGVYTGGYSDHFPVYILLTRTKDKQTSR